MRRSRVNGVPQCRTYNHLISGANKEPITNDQDQSSLSSFDQGASHVHEPGELEPLTLLADDDGIIWEKSSLQACAT